MNGDGKAISWAIDQHERDIAALRKLLWLRHGHSGLYGDDGEMQCGQCGIDFKRLPVDEIVKAFEARALQAMARQSESPSLMEVGRRLHAGESTLEQTFTWMKEGSCSVLLNWQEGGRPSGVFVGASEDDGNLWECSWIVGGKRYTGLQKDIRLAVLEAINKCIAEWCE